ncbi:O-antigen polysaccharide polymerase Wzy [Nocardioides albidus]|uniref:O-antigen polysaccharide polymerase Wzy n=1 Tax=Nocardioides albidus TaxID=1517589 RepID=UPI001305366A|nr:O-antigen polysaccharide polymerase Wzy [Nocardioides albidus]
MAVGAAAVVAVDLAWSLVGDTTDPRLLAVQFVLAVTGAAAITFQRGRGLASAALLYLVVFGLFHGGLLVAFAVQGESVLIGQGDNSWVFSRDVGQAVRISIVGVAAWVVGYVVVRDGGNKKFLIRESGRDLGVGAARVGLAATIMGGVLVWRSFVAGGVGIGSTYAQFIESGSPGYAYGILLVGFGCAYLVASRTPRTGWVIFACAALLLLPIGTRSAVLFPGVALVYIVGRRRRIGPVVGLSAMTVGLTLISVLRQTRLDGIAGIMARKWSLTPMDGLAEMGYSLYPVVAVGRWLERGESERYGATLFAVPARFLTRVSGGAVPPAEGDDRLFNVLVMRREGPIGGSPIAEGLLNGGLLGIVLLMFVIGAAIAWADLQESRAGVLAGLAVFLPLIFETRNSFAPVPAQVCLGLVMLIAARLLSPPLPSRSGTGNRRPHTNGAS